MTACNNTNLLKQYIPNDNPSIFILGEIKRIKLNVYQPKTNDTLPSCSDLTRNNIVVPTTISVTSASISVFNCLDLTTALITDTPTIADIIDNASQKIGVQISYSINTSISPLNAVGSYVAVITYTVDGSETFIVPYYIEVISISCITGNC